MIEEKDRRNRYKESWTRNRKVDGTKRQNKKMSRKGNKGKEYKLQLVND